MIGKRVIDPEAVDRPLVTPGHYIDLTAAALPPPAPFWMLTRWTADAALVGLDITAIEREEAAAAGVTDFDDNGLGLAFHRKDDADKVAMALAARLCIVIGVFGPGDDGKDGVWVALPPQLRRIELPDQQDRPAD